MRKASVVVAISIKQIMKKSPLSTPIIMKQNKKQYYMQIGFRIRIVIKQIRPPGASFPFFFFFWTIIFIDICNGMFQRSTILEPIFFFFLVCSLSFQCFISNYEYLNWCYILLLHRAFPLVHREISSRG